MMCCYGHVCELCYVAMGMCVNGVVLLWICVCCVAMDMCVNGVLLWICVNGVVLPWTCV